MLIGKDLFDYHDVGFDKYYETWDKVASDTDLLDNKKRELGKLYIDTASELDPVKKLINWGRIFQIKRDIHMLEHSEDNLKLLKDKKQVKQIRSVYEKVNDILNSFKRE